MIGCKKCEFSKYIPLESYQFWDRYRCSKPLPAARGGQFITGDGFANYRGPCWNCRLTYGVRVPEACRRLLARVRKELQDVLWSVVNDRRYRDRLSFCDFREENRMPLLHACRIYFRSELSEPEFLYFWSLMPIACPPSPSPIKKPWKPAVYALCIGLCICVETFSDQFDRAIGTTTGHQLRRRAKTPTNGRLIALVVE